MTTVPTRWRRTFGEQLAVAERRVREQLPSLFAALTELDPQQALTSSWAASDAEPYVREARSYITDTRRQWESWLEQD